MNANFVTRLLGQLIKTPVLVKTILYLPIIPRLQKMLALMQTTSQMTWHYEPNDMAL